MGGEIAQAIAAADIPVVVKDIDQKFVDAALEKARAVTQGQLAGQVKKERITQEQADARLAEVMGNITGTTSYAEFADVDFVIEAVPEKMGIKQSVFREIDAATPGHAILSSNTSSLSITEMGEATLRADKVVGFHFFYPASIRARELNMSISSWASGSASPGTFCSPSLKKPSPPLFIPSLPSPTRPRRPSWT